MDNDLISLGNVRNVLLKDRVLECARRLLNHMDLEDDQLASRLIHELVLKDTHIAFEIASLVYKLKPLSKLDTSRQSLNRILKDAETFAEISSYSSSAHTLFASWLSILLLAPFAIDPEKLDIIFRYALSDVCHCNVRGKLLAAIIIRNRRRLEDITDAPIALRLSALAGLVKENVMVNADFIPDAAGLSDYGNDAEVNYITVLTAYPKLANSIVTYFNHDSMIVVSHAGASLARSLLIHDAEGTHRSQFLESELKTMQVSQHSLLLDDKLGFLAFLCELTKSEQIALSPWWRSIVHLWVTVLRFENPVSNQRTIMCHQLVIKSLLFLSRRKRIPVESIPTFLNELLRLVLWHTDGMTRCSANSVLQEIIGRYALHEARDLIPNLSQDSSSEGQPLGDYIATRLLPLALHSNLGYQACIIEGIESLLAYECSTHARHTSTLHFMLEKTSPKTGEIVINNAIQIIWSNMEMITDSSRWQHAQYLALVTALITVRWYRPGVTTREYLVNLCEKLLEFWSRDKPNCTTSSLSRMFCHAGDQLQPTVRYFEALRLSAVYDEMHDRFLAVITGHKCIGVRLIVKEWHLLSDDDHAPPPINWKVLPTLAPLALLKVLPNMLYTLFKAGLRTSESEDMALFMDAHSYSILQASLPLTLMISFIDLCGYVNQLNHPIFGEMVNAILTKNLNHPEPAIRALCGEWLNRGLTNPIGGKWLWWRLRSRQVGVRSQSEWCDLMGDTETTGFISLLSPSYHFSTPPLPTVSRSKNAIHLLGSNHHAMWAKAVCADWGISSCSLEDCIHGYNGAAGRWDKKGWMYAAALSYLRGDRVNIDIDKENADWKDSVMAIVAGNGDAEVSRETAEMGISLGILKPQI